MILVMETEAMQTQDAQKARQESLSVEECAIEDSTPNVLHEQPDGLLQAKTFSRSAYHCVTLEDLFARWKIEVKASVLNRMRTRYSSRVSIILIEKQQKFALETYKLAEMLPGTSTFREIYDVHGYWLNGDSQSDNPLIMCVKESRVYVLKNLNAAEYESSIAMRNDLAPGSDQMAVFHPYIVPIHLFTAKEKLFCAMPMYYTTFNHLPVLKKESDVTLFWNCISSALEYLHEKGYAHMDVKPSNICFAEHGYVLIDLGSMRRFGECTSSTEAYLPLELKMDPFISSASTDWWMLAIVLVESACCLKARGRFFLTKAKVRSVLEASPLRGCFEGILQHLI